VQYLKWIGGVATGDLGESLRTQEPVLGKLLQVLPITVELSLLGLVMASCFGIPLGIVSAIRRNSAVDFWARFAGLAGLSVPNFWLATMLLLISSLPVGAQCRLDSAYHRPAGQCRANAHARLCVVGAIDGDPDAHGPHDDARGVCDVVRCW
jgi:ABC-type dipeptide/oligopeptide/nickel transport system permease component